MNKNWIGIAFYILFIAVITYFVGAFTEAEKAQEFLGDIKEEVKDNDLDLISSMIVANYNDGTESYIKKQPLFEESYVSSKVSLTVKIYALVEKNQNTKSNSVYILIRDLNLNVDDLKQDDYGDDIIKANIEFNQVVTIGQTSKSDFNESFATLYDNNTKAFIIPYSKLSAASEIEIKSITIKYVLMSDLEVNILTLANSSLTTISTNDQFGEEANRDIINVSSQNIKLTEAYQTDLETSDDIYYNKTHMERLQSYNVLYIKNILVEMLFLIPITYLIFFLKPTIAYIKEKKQKREANIRNYQKELEKNEKENT